MVVGIQESARLNNIIVAVKLAGHRALHRVRGALVQRPPTGSPRAIRPALHPAERRVGVYRLVRRAARRRRGVFRLYRIRCGLDRGAGSQSPMRDMPIGILGSLAICAVLYIAVGLVLTGIVPYDRLNVAGSDRGRDRCRRHRLAFSAGQTGDHPGPDLGHPGDAARRSRGFFAPWRMTGYCRRWSPPSIRVSVRLTSRPSPGGIVVAVLSGCCRRTGRRTRQYRDVVRICRRLVGTLALRVEGARTGQRRSGRRRSGSSRPPAPQRRFSDVGLPRRHLDQVASGCWSGLRSYLFYGAKRSRLRTGEGRQQ